MLWMHEAGNIPHIRWGYDTNRATDWIGLTAADTCIHGNPRPGNNAQGYGWDDLLLLFKYNTTNWVGTFPGWNPADDTNGNGCIEPGEGNNGAPSNPNRSAQDYWDARVLRPSAPGKPWMMCDVTSPGYIAFFESEANYEYDTWGVEGFHFDEAAYEPASLGLTNTFKYEGQNEASYSFQYQEDKKALISAVMVGVESHMGGPVVAFGNMVSTYYTCMTAQEEACLEHMENSLLEAWVVTGGGSTANTSKRESILECPFNDYLSAGKGLFLNGYDMSNSDRGKIFTLGMFYLINHQMAFYYYRNNGHDARDVENTEWNPYVEFDVGQPMVNDLGFNDFDGNSGTNKFFVFATGATYEILGREFLRSDNKKVLVLVKLMAPGQTEGTGSAAHALGGTYKRLQSNLTLGSNVSSVYLTMNDAAILVKQQSGGGCQGCGFED